MVWFRSNPERVIGDALLAIREEFREPDENVGGKEIRDEALEGS
jgi:hypothetical protein